MLFGGDFSASSATDKGFSKSFRFLWMVSKLVGPPDQRKSPDGMPGVWKVLFFSLIRPITLSFLFSFFINSAGASTSARLLGFQRLPLRFPHTLLILPPLLNAFSFVSFCCQLRPFSDRWALVQDFRWLLLLPRLGLITFRTKQLHFLGRKDTNFIFFDFVQTILVNGIFELAPKKFLDN